MKAERDDDGARKQRVTRTGWTQTSPPSLRLMAAMLEDKPAFGTRPTARIGSTEVFCHWTDPNLPGAIWCQTRTHRPMLQAGGSGPFHGDRGAYVAGHPDVA